MIISSLTAENQATLIVLISQLLLIINLNANIIPIVSQKESVSDLGSEGGNI